MSGEAFGAPGIAPTWCSSDKDFVTTGLGSGRVWITIGHGIIDEVYWPSTGEPQIRDFSFYLVGEKGFIDLKRVRRYRFSTPGPYLPTPTITHYGDDYELTLEILPDTRRDALLVRFNIKGPYRLVAVLAPHLGSTGRDNRAWVEDGRGYAQRGDFAVCFSTNALFRHLSAGYVGASDGWQDLHLHGGLTFDFSSASHGTVALSGEAVGSSGTIGVDGLRQEFLDRWQWWGSKLKLPRPDERLGDAGLLSAAVLKTHEDRTYPGAMVASLSVPWGNSTDTLGGYHLVWPRDATLTAFALLAANQVIEARHILAHLTAAQGPDGRWPQNYFPSGEAFWTGVQLDEAAFPILLAAKLRELGDAELPGTAQMVRAAVGFVVRTGPHSDQDRWEENPGVSPFSLAVAIAALIAAAPWLNEVERLRADQLADDWNERLEAWCYVQGTPLAKQLGVAGYYVRIATSEKSGELSGTVLLRNRQGEQIEASALVSLDFSYLVRLGLRSAHDPRIQDTIKVVDKLLRVETPSGPLYYRYNEDGYGEHADGRPFDGQGIGRAWPLLAGERGHLALQSGEDPLPYLNTIWNCASVGGMLPEQVWESAPIPAFELEPGRPSGSAMPLLWAHAEFLKLLIAREHGKPVELLDAVAARYGHGAVREASVWHWRHEVPIARLEAGKALRIEDRVPFTLHFGFNGWKELQDREAAVGPFGLWIAELSAAELAPHGELNFTRHYNGAWEGEDHSVQLGHIDVEHTLRHVEG